ncbi:MAG: hypothetical protein HY258_09530 [Chloroflexi bacterium]|nr:hypothetical protein [Chloroflexota bacterium]
MVEESSFGLYLDLLQAFERLNIPYVIIGAFAGTSYGVTRLTVDVDIVVDLDEANIQALASAYPSPRFYADPQQMRDSIRQGILFNIIDTSEGRKVDLIPLTMNPGYGFALKRRVRREIPLNQMSFSAWFARPDDVIVGKLMAWKEGRSFKHEQDIRDILVAIRLGEDPDIATMSDLNYVERWAIQLGTETAQFWRGVKTAAGL